MTNPTPLRAFDYPEWDGQQDIDAYKRGREIALRVHHSLQSPLMALRDARGRRLFRVTESGHITRTRKVSSRIRRLVRARDRACVWCGSGQQLEIDHIVRYADGGPNTPENLRVLCKPCHDTRRGGDQ